MHVSFLKEPRNALSYRHSSLHMILFSSNRCFLLVDGKSEIHGNTSSKGPIGETRNAEVLNGASQMTRNLIERISRLCSKTGRCPGEFPSLNLDRSHSELATA